MRSGSEEHHKINPSSGYGTLGAVAVENPCQILVLILRSTLGVLEIHSRDLRMFHRSTVFADEEIGQPIHVYSPLVKDYLVGRVE
jgi:hypothetical protein